jgi:thymidylate synthase ThyX
MSSLTSWPYDPALGVTVPPAIAEAGLSGILLEGAEESEAMALRLGGASDPASAYALLNAHRRRCLWTLNLREFYHVSRLREDEHAQWDIRYLTVALSDLVRRAFPVCSGHLGGKDRFPAPPGGPR